MAATCCEVDQKCWSPLYKGILYTRSQILSELVAGVEEPFDLTGYTFSCKLRLGDEILTATLAAPIPSNGAITLEIAATDSADVTAGDWVGQFFIFNSDGSVFFAYEPLLTIKEVIT